LRTLVTCRAQERLQHCIEQFFLIAIHIFYGNACTGRRRGRNKVPVKTVHFFQWKNSFCFLFCIQSIDKSKSFGSGGLIDLFILRKNGKRQ
jgi:hypothetical protein